MSDETRLERALPKTTTEAGGLAALAAWHLLLLNPGEPIEFEGEKFAPIELLALALAPIAARCQSRGEVIGDALAGALIQLSELLEAQTSRKIGSEVST